MNIFDIESGETISPSELKAREAGTFLSKTTHTLSNGQACEVIEEGPVSEKDMGYIEFIELVEQQYEAFETLQNICTRLDKQDHEKITMILSCTRGQIEKSNKVIKHSHLADVKNKRIKSLEAKIESSIEQLDYTINCCNKHEQFLPTSIDSVLRTLQSCFSAQRRISQKVLGGE